MAEIHLTAAFSTVPPPEQEAIKRLLAETVEQIAQDDRTFSRAKLVFTESDERCGLTAELDGVKRKACRSRSTSTSSRMPRPARARAPSSRRRSGSTSAAWQVMRPAR